MKTKFNYLPQTLAALVTIIVIASGCDGLPKAYQGEFADSSIGAKIKLEKAKATLTENGKKLEGKFSEVKPEDTYKKLLKGEPNAYVVKDDKDDRFLDVYWIMPNLSTRQTDGPIVWNTADIIYARIDRQAEGRLQSVEMVRSREAVVMFDTQKGEWQAGWAPNPQYYRFVRTDGKKD